MLPGPICLPLELSFVSKAFLDKVFLLAVRSPMIYSFTFFDSAGWRCRWRCAAFCAWASAHRHLFCMTATISIVIFLASLVMVPDGACHTIDP